MSIKHTKPIITPRCYRVGQLCVLLQTSRSTIYKMMNAGKLPFVEIGGRRAVPATAIEELLQPQSSPNGL
jgi:excisionase family DNA binding protein